MHLLIIDDEDSVALIIRRLAAFTRPDWTITSYTNPYEGIQFAIHDGNKIDLIMTDMQMPTLSGAEVIERIREHEATTRIPIVLMSKDTWLTCERQLSEYPDAFLSKLIDVDTIIEQIEAAVNGDALEMNT